MPNCYGKLPQSSWQVSALLVRSLRESFEIEVVDIEILRKVVTRQHSCLTATEEHWRYRLRRYALNGDPCALHLDVQFHGYLRDGHVVDHQVHHQPSATALRHRRHRRRIWWRRGKCGS